MCSRATRPFFRIRIARETLDAGLPRPEHPHVDRVEIRTLAVVGDRPADDQHFRELRQSLENGIADPSADRVEEQMYTFRASLAKAQRSTPRMVETGVRAQLSRDDRAFFRSAGDADDFHARKFAELDRIAADRAGGGRHNEGLTRHRAAEHLHRTIRGQARRAECG